jgi:hypothetical protein
VTQVRGRARVGWELLRILQESLMGLEETASRVLAAQVAGLITLWTQLYTFEEGPPEVIAWTALFLFMASICFIGVFLRPRRIVRFWDRALPDELFGARAPVTLDQEAHAIEHISTTMRHQRDHLERGIRVSVPLGLAALALTALAYILDKAFYPP